MGMSMRSRLVAVAGLVVAAGPALAPSTAQAQGDIAGSAHVRGMIVREAEALAREGYVQAQPGIHSRATRAEVRRYVLRLEEGKRYALIAACDQGCSHVDLALYDGRRGLLARSNEPHAIVTVAGAARAAGLYEVEVKLPGCRERSCELAFAVLWQGKAPAPEPVVIASSTPPSAGVLVPSASGPAPAPAPAAPAAPAAAAPAPAVAGFTHKIERRPGYELEANNYREQKVASLEDCEQMCLADRNCAALEFYREQRSCGLFRQVPSLRPARNIDVGIKRAR
jgi:hypothetical protein